VAPAPGSCLRPRAPPPRAPQLSHEPQTAIRGLRGGGPRTLSSFRLLRPRLRHVPPGGRDASTRATIPAEERVATEPKGGIWLQLDRGKHSSGDSRGGSSPGHSPQPSPQLCPADIIIESRKTLPPSTREGVRGTWPTEGDPSLSLQGFLHDRSCQVITSPGGVLTIHRRPPSPPLPPFAHRLPTVCPPFSFCGHSGGAPC